MIIQPSTSNGNPEPYKDSDLQSANLLMEEIQTKFWVIFFIYVCCSAAWVAYCIYTHRRDVERLEEQSRLNSVARFLELQRLLDAYNRIDIENGPNISQDKDESVA